MDGFRSIIVLYLIAVNIVGFFISGMDKYKAVHKKWRISENSFMLLAALGGGLGVYMGCLVFNHKVRSIKFMIGIPAIFIAETAILLLFL